MGLFRPRKPYLADVVARHFPTDRSIRILDVGCGHGAFLYVLEKLGYNDLSGIDISEEQIELAHKLGIAQARLGKLEQQLAALPEASLDVVLAMDVLEHLTKQELYCTLREIRRVLKAHGCCIAHVSNAEGLYGMRIRYGDMTHEQAFTP